MDNHKDHQKPEGTKLTAVSIGHGRYKRVFFAWLPHRNGEAILPEAALNKALNDLGCTMRGQTYSIGV